MIVCECIYSHFITLARNAKKKPQAKEEEVEVQDEGQEVAQGGQETGRAAAAAGSKAGQKRKPAERAPPKAGGVGK